MRAKLISILLITLLALSSCNDLDDENKEDDESVWTTVGLNSKEACMTRLYQTVYPYIVYLKEYDKNITKVEFLKKHGGRFISNCHRYLNDNKCFQSIRLGIRHQDDLNYASFYNDILEICN